MVKKKSNECTEEMREFMEELEDRLGERKECKCGTKANICGPGPSGAVYGLGFLGALVYYVTTAPDFWGAVIGFFKALLWPAFLVFAALKSLGA